MEPYSTFNTLARRAKDYSPIEKEDLIDTYKKIEATIYTGVDYLLLNTTFVEDNLCYLLAEIQAGPIKSRKVYRGKRNPKRVGVGHEVEVGSENRRIFGIGFDIFKLSRVERDKSAVLVRKVIRLMRLNNNFFESVLFTFQKETRGYCDLVDELATLRAWYDENDSRKSRKKEIIGVVQRMSELMDKISMVELSVGTLHPTYLYGTIKIVNNVVKRTRLLQERIFRAYLRIILKPVRDKAMSEAEALDLYQSASLGLSRAISLYDFRSGVNFSTFAKQWVHQRIYGSAKTSSGPLIRLPGSFWELNQKIQMAKRHFEKNPKTRYTYRKKDIAQFLNITPESLDSALKKMELTKIGSLDDIVRQQDGMDSGLNKDTTLEDVSIEEERDLKEIQGKLDSILGRLTPDSRKLICLQSGVLEGIPNNLDPEQTLREIFRQLACKAVVHERLAKQADQIIISRSERLEK
jgi:RNA polymerase sigma factor (sigma-70 family)